MFLFNKILFKMTRPSVKGGLGGAYPPLWRSEACPAMIHANATIGTVQELGYTKTTQTLKYV